MDANLIIAIQDSLWELGVTENYIGYHYTSYAVYCSIEQPGCLLLVTKWLYPSIAKKYGTSSAAVERNIRTILDMVWRKNKDTLEQIARHKLDKKPTATQFISILAYGIKGKVIA